MAIPTADERPGEAGTRSLGALLSAVRARLAVVHRRALTGLALAGILAFNWTMARIPHTGLGAGDAYPFPRHVDEWFHWGHSAAIWRQQTLSFTTPWRGRLPETFQGIPFYNSLGFHAYLAVLRDITGIHFLDIFQYGPALTLCVVAVGAYAIGDRYGYGLEAALLTALVPTTPRFLGPAFLVSVTFSIVVFLPLVLLALRRNRFWAIPLALLMSLGLWTLHARVALFMLIPVLLACLARLRERPDLSVGIAVAVILPIAIVLPAFLSEAVNQTLRDPSLPIERTVLEGFGLATLGLFGIGVGWALVDRGERKEPLILALTALVALSLVFARPFIGSDPGGMYDRAHMLFFFTAAPVAAYGAARLRQLTTRAGSPLRELTRDRRWRAAFQRTLPAALAVALLATSVAGAVDSHREELYYRVIGEKDWDAFQWMEENVPAHRDLVLLVPWKGLALGAISERRIYETQFPGHTVQPDSLSMRTAVQGEVDIGVLQSHGIDIVYTRAPLGNTDLEQVHERIYLVPEDGG